MEVTRAILDVLPSDNPLDDPDFDPLAYMNARFTDEASLGELDSFAIELEASIQATNQELRETVRAQVEGGGQAEQNLTEARASILHLFEKVEEIRSMAEESENMVKEICTEISSLDNAKKNLTESMSTLRRMRDLSRYLDSLRASSDSEPCDLAAAAEGIHAISTILSKHFSGHMDVPRIAELNEKFLREKKLSSQAALQHLKDTDFSREDVEATSVIDACAVIDACGDEVRVAAVTSLVQNNIERYKAAFPAHADEAKLAKMERRLAWFRRLLKAYETNLEDHIPAAWCVPQELAVEYCLVTRGAIDEQLQGSSDELNIEIVVRVLQKTKEFEKDLTQRMQKGKQARSGQEYKYEGFITSCFEDVMGLYVRHEDDRMKNVVQSLLAEGGENLLALSGGESGQPATLPAAFGVFMYIGQSLEKCTAFCNDAVLVKLYNTWTSNLVMFANELCNRIPTKTAETQDDINICVLINTADWSHDQSLKLAEGVRSKVDLEHGKDIDEEASADQFRTVINKGVHQLIANMNKKLTPALNQMTAVNWTLVDDVGDQSPYVTALCQVMAVNFAVLAQYLQPALYRYLCDKFITVFVPRYVSMFYKLKRLSHVACQQLLLDTQVLKGELPKVPNIGKPDRFREKELKSYNMLLKSNVAKGEAILKFVGTEVPLEGNFYADQYTEMFGQDASVADFSKLMELKGVAQREYKPLVEYLVKVKGLQQSAARDASAYQPPAASTAEAAVESTKEISETLKRWKGRWGDGVSKFKDMSKDMQMRRAAN